jgi:hypothetical protein
MLDINALSDVDRKFLESKLNLESFVTLINALMFYGEPDNYFAVSIRGDRPCGEIADDIGEIQVVTEAGEVLDTETRHGQRARTALDAVFGN